MPLLGMANKHKNYIKKCVSEGRCPHCGRFCAPFYECDERRTNRRLVYKLNRMTKAGFLEKSKGKDGKSYYSLKDNSKKITFYKEGDGDKRRFPRLGKTYIDLMEICKDILKASPINERKLLDNAMTVIWNIKRF